MLRTDARDGDGAPCHIVAVAGDRKSICRVRNPLPVIWARWAGHEHYDRLYCAECVRGLLAAEEQNQKHNQDDH